jgi:peptide/nickel transport system substrate-binding protein
MRVFGRLALAGLMMLCGLGLANAKDSLTLGLPIEPSGLDPTIAAPVAIRQVTWGNVFEGLVTIGEDGKIKPLLAKSWTISGDGMSYTFQLRSGVKFHNGTAFDSSIVKFSLDRARAADSTNAQKQFFESIDTIETPDPMTAVIKLRKQDGLFVYHLGWGDAIMVDPKTVDDNKNAPVGTGPFKFKAWQRGSSVDLVRNDDYWDKGVPKLATVRFRFITDAQAQVAALQAGDIDAFLNLGAPELFSQFQSDSRFIAISGNTTRKLVAGLNTQRPPFDNPKVRQAMMSAIDRDAVKEASSSGYGTVIGTHFDPTAPGYLDLTGVIPFDPKKAKELLKEAGFPNGFTATMKCPQMPYTVRACEVIQALLGDVGITLKVENREFPAKWIDEVFLKHDFDMTIIDHAEPLDIEIYSRPTYYFGYKNPAFNDIVAKAYANSSEEERSKLFGEAEKILAQDVPALYLYAMPRLSVWNAKLQGLWKDEPIPAAVVRDVHWAD